MHRVLIPPEAAQGGIVTIREPRTVHHLLRVLRVKAGEPLECIDGQGRRYAGVVTQRASQHLTVSVTRMTKEPGACLEITLAQALIEPARFEWALQKSTELGVTRLIPMLTHRTLVRPGSAPGPSRLSRWRRIIESASTQCGRAALPILEEPQRFQAVVASCQGRLGLLPTLVGSAETLQRALGGVRPGQDVVLLIGPEGDFTDEEVALAVEGGLRPVRLGALTLRSETAAVAALALLQHAAGVL